MSASRLLPVLLLAAAAAAGAWLVLADPGGAPAVVPDEDVPDRPVGEGVRGPTPLERERGARETFGREPEPEPSVREARVAQTRVVVPGADAEGMARGGDLAKALAAVDGLEVRWESEALRAEFLRAPLRLPAEAFLPPESPMGVHLPVLSTAIGEAGFQSRFVSPVLWIGAKR